MSVAHYVESVKVLLGLKVLTLSHGAAFLEQRV